MSLNDTLKSIKNVNPDLEPAIRARLDNLTKPPGSLGYLEDIAAKYCLITNTTKPVLGKKAIFTFAGDHGVADEGVSAFPKEVTFQMVMNMLGGGAAVNVLSRHAGVDQYVVDIGVDADFNGVDGLLHRKVWRGTRNIAVEPAMTVDEAIAAIEVGISLAQEACRNGVTLIGTGEMGIANTTPSSALYAALLPYDADEMTGRGTGINVEGINKKAQVIKRALEVNKECLTDPLNTLAALGGLEIAGICGLCLGAASERVPVVVDGFISSAGALAACRICEPVKDYLFFSHCSDERGHRAFLEEFGVRPILDLSMRLGEGTGAALAMQIIEASVKIYNEMATFDGAGVCGESTN